VIGIGLFEGKQSSNVNANYKMGFFLFIVSEAVFFLGIF
jgi:heme/copper-type cytochrome/quinol oxidase subunit 3